MRGWRVKYYNRDEVGRYPLAISATLLSIKYWTHIYNDEIPKARNRFTFQSLINGDEIKSSYGEHIIFLKIIGFDHVWQNKGTFSKRRLINAVEKKGIIYSSKRQFLEELLLKAGHKINVELSRCLKITIRWKTIFV